MTALFDSGGTISLIHKHMLSTEVTPLISTNQIFTTLAGEFQSNRQVLVQDIVLPEFKRTAYIINHTCQVFTGLRSYDIILGQDFSRKIYFHINFNDNTMNCMDMSGHMRSSDFFSDHTRLRDIMFSYNVEIDTFASTITKSTYHSVSISTIVDTPKHLSLESETHRTLPCFLGIINVGDAHRDAPHFSKTPMSQRRNSLALNSSK